MNVVELIDTVSIFSFGTLATKRQREDYLRCLNFANNDIYLRLRNYKDFLDYSEIKVSKDLTSNIYYIPFDFSKNTIKSIYKQNLKLASFSLLNNENLFIGDKQYFELFSENKILFNNKDNFDRDIDGDFYVKVFSLKPYKKLVEIIDDPDIEADETIYPEMVQQCLILGAVYYVYLTTNGQLNKLSSVFSLYEKKLEDLNNFYNNL